MGNTIEITLKSDGWYGRGEPLDSKVDAAHAGEWPWMGLEASAMLEEASFLAASCFPDSAIVLIETAPIVVKG